MARRALVCVSAMTLMAASVRAAGDGEPAAPPPDVKGMVEAGARTARELGTRPASWTVITRGTASLTDLQVKVVSAGGRRHLSFTATNPQGAPVEFADVIERDGVWYVTEGEQRGKYRPYECPFQLPLLSTLYKRAAPMVLVESAVQVLGRFKSVDAAGVATYAQPLGAEQRRLLEGILRQFNEAVASGAVGADEKAKLDRQVRQMEGLLRDGQEIRVDVARGLLLTYGSVQLMSEVRDFRWLDADTAAPAFDLGPHVWEDHTTELSDRDMEELVLIGHCGMWRPGMGSMDTEAQLLHLPTGMVRRVPFNGDAALVGCFTRDRRAVLVVGVDTVQGKWGLYEVDLKTGENREIGQDVLAGRVPFGPTLSPDGKTVAVMRVDLGRDVFGKQMCLIDLATGHGRTIGSPLDAAGIHWQPGGRGLLITRIDKSADPKAPGGRTIVRMDLDGTAVDLRKGEVGDVLGDGRILLLDETGARRMWRTCDGDGGNERAYGDGLEKCMFPSVAPDGKRVLFMRMGGATGPRPVIVEDGRVVRDVWVGPGLWAMPAWR